MFEQIYHHANALWPLWGICLFAGIIAWAFWPSNKSRFEKDAQIPFDDDEPSPKMELR